MRWLPLTCLVIALIVSKTNAQWSWGSETNDKTEQNVEEKSSELLEGEQGAVAEDKNIEVKDSVLDDIVDELVSSKQGRSLGGFDDVYSDPTIKEALDAGDDAEAKNLIKSRLCTLGLVQCDDEETQEKRFVSPEHLIYAQPVALRPVGKPVASIPLRGPPRTYGPAKPMYPPRPQKISTPPKRVGYGGYPRPEFADKYGSSGSFQFSQNNGLYSGNDNNYVTRPSYATESPYLFENAQPSFNKVPVSPPKTEKKVESIVQQHVHHHYVHDDGDKNSKVIIKPVAIPVGSVGHLSTQLQSSQSDVITANGDDYSSFSSGGFKPMSAGYALDSKPVYEPDTVYGSQFGQSNKGNAAYLSQSLPNQYQNNNFDEQKYGNSLGNFGSQNSEFYKKELNVGSGNNIYNQGAQTFSQNGLQGNYHEAKAQGFECVCVNYDQCPSQEIIGRRDDLYLPIDPRNKGTDIDALSEDQLDNITKIETQETINKAKNETESRRKRETVKEDKIDVDSTKEIEPRFIGLPGYGGQGGNNHKQVQPTFGVSFGLPQPSHGGYPLNPFSSNPIYNPYGPALNSGGLNLGLLSVNPLLSVQVTKNDYGEKVVKPFVNLHVTPNEHVVNKIGNLFHEKKHYLLNKHEHYHHYKPHLHGHYDYGHHDHGHVGYDHFDHSHYNHGPIVGHQHAPIHHESHFEQPIPHEPHYPLQHGPHVYSPHYPHYDPGFAKIHPHIAPEPVSHNDDYYDDDNGNQQFGYNYDYNNGYQGAYSDPGYERSANISNQKQNNYANRYAYSRSLTLPSKSPGVTRERQSIRFPANRKKREITVEKASLEAIEERQGYFGRPQQQQCKANQVCCRRPLKPQASNRGQCGIRHSQGVNGRIKTPQYVDGDSEFGEYPWQAAILKKDPKESVYVCGGTLIDGSHIMTAAHCIKSYKGFELRVRLGEWDVNHDVEFYPYVERDVASVHVHPLYYAGTLDNDLAILKLEHPVDWTKYPHISPACLPDKYTEYAGQRCWTTGWGKDAFGDNGKYQNILKEVDVPVLPHGQCQQQLKQTRLGYNYELNPGFVCAGGEEGKDACKGDGGGPLVCERGGTWQLVGVVSWGIGCGQVGVPGVYVKVAHYLDWISQITGKYSPY